MSKTAAKSDLFSANNEDKTSKSYSAKDIEVLEGLEPVRRRPGMYIGGTDERALHHLAAEIIDNAMDEAVAGHATRIEIELADNNVLSVRDNGRGIPVDPHPKFKPKSALEIIMTTLHSGGKFQQGAYETSGGLHGVGSSVVNALSEWLEVEVARDRNLWMQRYERGVPVTKLKDLGSVQNRRGTTVRFKPDIKIFGPDAHFKPGRLYKLARSKAYLFRGVEIRWNCDPALIHGNDTTPAEETLHFPGGLCDYLESLIGKASTVTPKPFSGRVETKESKGIVEWAVTWSPMLDPFSSSYCNTIPTPQGGTHESGLRSSMARSLRAYGELVNNRKAPQITADDVMTQAQAMLSIFIREPQFQGQTKDKLSNPEAQRLVEGVIKDHLDHWLADSPVDANKLLGFVIEQAEERIKRRQEKEISRQSATRKLRLPGKLADCSSSSSDDTELFLVEGDSAGGSAKQAQIGRAHV